MPRVVRQPRLPLRPLLALIAAENTCDAARKLGKDRAQMVRLIRDGVTFDTADRLAVAAGMHPAEVWPDWYEVTDVELVAS